MGYDATPADAELIDYDELEGVCMEMGGEMVADTRCVIEGKDGSELAIDNTATQTSRQTSIEYRDSDGVVVTGTNNADEILVNPDRTDLHGHVSSPIASEIPDHKDVVIAVRESGTMSTFGLDL